MRTTSTSFLERWSPTPHQFWAVVAVAVALRACGMLWAPNVDLAAYRVTAQLVLEGANVYANHASYNYGPVWMHVLAALRWIAGEEGFRVAVCASLCAVDVGIAALVRGRGQPVVALLFLLSPWTFFITGHHHQFDNVALLMGLAAVRWAEVRGGRNEALLNTLSVRDTLVGAGLLGLSLMTKHIFFLFPLWIAFRVRNPLRRVLWLAVPVGMFFAGFLPFWAEGEAGIRAHVFGYRASSTASFFNLVAPNALHLFGGYSPHPDAARWAFLAGLAAAGALVRRRGLWDAVLMYTAFLVVCSSGLGIQHFAIPVLFTAAYRSRWGWVYNLLALPYYVLDNDSSLGYNLPLGWMPDGMFAVLRNVFGFHLFVALLAGALAEALWPGWMRRGWEEVRRRLSVSLLGG